MDEPNAGLDPEERVIDLQKQAVVISTTYESSGLTARIMDENMVFIEAENIPSTLEDAYVYFMGGEIHA